MTDPTIKEDVAELRATFLPLSSTEARIITRLCDAITRLCDALEAAEDSEADARRGLLLIINGQDCDTFIGPSVCRSPSSAATCPAWVVGRWCDVCIAHAALDGTLPDPPTGDQP